MEKGVIVLVIECNAEGTVLGAKHAQEWKKFIKLNEKIT